MWPYAITERDGTGGAVTSVQVVCGNINGVIILLLPWSYGTVTDRSRFHITTGPRAQEVNMDIRGSSRARL